MTETTVFNCGHMVSGFTCGYNVIVTARAGPGDCCMIECRTQPGNRIQVAKIAVGYRKDVSDIFARGNHTVMA